MIVNGSANLRSVDAVRDTAGLFERSKLNGTARFAPYRLFSFVQPCEKAPALRISSQTYNYEMDVHGITPRNKANR